MESLVAWVRVTHRKRLRVVDGDADRQQTLVAKLGASRIPSLALMDGRTVASRLEGRATGREIDPTASSFPQVLALNDGSALP